MVASIALATSLFCLGERFQAFHSTSVIWTFVAAKVGPVHREAGWPISPHQVQPWTRISLSKVPHMGTFGNSGSVKRSRSQPSPSGLLYWKQKHLEPGL